LKNLPYRVFESKLDKLLEKIPPLGKLLSSLFGFFEVYILELFRKIDKKFKIYTLGIINKYILRGRWGGKVVPLGKNISVETKFISSQEILGILIKSKVVGISWCYCRTTQRKDNEPICDHPLNTCIHLGFGESLYEVPFKSSNLKEVSKNEIKSLLETCDERGLVHQIIFFPNPQFYYIICNCCPCCCVVLNNFLSKGSPQMIKSDFFAKTDSSLCINCGKCEIWCYFGARVMKHNRLKINSIRCFGCGICVSKCPNNAISLNKLS
jgi:NAD-dependent dihydropyrimidine dehydrogenase PreA subunit